MAEEDTWENKECKRVGRRVQKNIWRRG